MSASRYSPADLGRPTTAPTRESHGRDGPGRAAHCFTPTQPTEAIVSSTDVSTLDAGSPRPALRGREQTAMNALRSDSPSATRTTGQTVASVG